MSDKVSVNCAEEEANFFSFLFLKKADKFGRKLTVIRSIANGRKSDYGFSLVVGFASLLFLTQ